MMYGRHAADLRDNLTWLLRQTAPPTDGAPYVVRYRDAILGFSADALATTSTGTISKNPRDDTVDAPAVVLRERLVETLSLGSDTRLLELASLRHRSEHLRHWQQAAKAAVVGGRDLAVAVTGAHPDQEWAATKDAADNVRAVVTLDRFYDSVSGYRPLPGRYPLAMAAVATSAIAREGRLDHTIDRLGWRQPERVEPPTGVGVTAATQAQRNVAVHLLRLPSAHNLRQALLAQMRVSVEASKLASDVGAPLLAEEFTHRATVYRDLMAAARNIDGRLGGASSVVSESAQAAALLAATERHGAKHSLEDLRELSRPTQLVDRRILAAIERGVEEWAYLVPTEERQLGGVSKGIRRAEPTWRHASPGEAIPLRDIARTQLHLPPAIPPTPDQSVTPGRNAYEALLAQHGTRPTVPGFRR